MEQKIHDRNLILYISLLLLKPLQSEIPENNLFSGILEGGFDEEGNFVFLQISCIKQITELYRRKVIKLFEELKLINQNFDKNLLP